jgi:hypothetical protein
MIKALRKEEGYVITLAASTPISVTMTPVPAGRTNEIFCMQYTPPSPPPAGARRGRGTAGKIGVKLTRKRIEKRIKFKIFEQ